jgi:hypothetical protein
MLFFNFEINMDYGFKNEVNFLGGIFSMSTICIVALLSGIRRHTENHICAALPQFYSSLQRTILGKQVSSNLYSWPCRFLNNLGVDSNPVRMPRVCQTPSWLGTDAFSLSSVRQLS